MKAQERDQLIADLLDGDLGEADFLRLEAEMHVDPAARAAYYDAVKLDTLLATAAEGDTAARSIRPQIATPRLKKPLLSFRPLAAAAAVVALASAALLGWKAGSDRAKPAVVETRPAAEPFAAGYGAVSQQDGATWAGDVVLNNGDLIPAGELELVSGLAQIELFSGVTVILEGGARFEVISPMEMSVAHGKVRALVPEPARGFRIATANGEIVDLGTEFAIDVSEAGADLHVLDGEIEWHPRGDAKRTMSRGQALRWEAARGAAELPFDAGRFTGFADFEQGLVAERAQRRAAWLRHSAALAADARLLAYFPMHGIATPKRRLGDASPAGRDGTVVRTEPASDRWEQQGGALDFSPTGSRVRVNIPGRQRSLTLYCWAKIDSLDRWYNSLFLTDSHELHEPHWQIMDDGRLFFSVKAHDTPIFNQDKQICYSPPFWTPALSGQWLQIATTYDDTTHTVTHYLNGEVLSSEEIANDMRFDFIEIGAASIGNWGEPKRKDPHFAVRNLNGAIDEFAVFSKALSAAEIKTFYDIGKP